MKRLVTLYQVNHFEKLAEVADGFLLGNTQFGTRLTKSFSIDEINQIVEQNQALQKELFLVANQMMTDEQLDSFTHFLKELPLTAFTGVIVGDIGAIMVLKKLGKEHLAIYNPETLLTNDYDFNHLSREHILGAFVAKEITLADLKRIGHSKKHALFMVGHGHLNMFYSKRQLLQNYLQYAGLSLSLHQKQNLTIVEERREETHPILEDEAGTHVFRAPVFHTLKVQKDLASWIDYLVIDTLFKDDEYGYQVLSLYRQDAPNEADIKKLQGQYQETWDEGFLYTKTIYQTKDLIDND